MAAAAPTAASTAPTPTVARASRAGSIARARRRSGAISGSHAASTSVVDILDAQLLQAPDPFLDGRVGRHQVHDSRESAAQRIYDEQVRGRRPRELVGTMQLALFQTGERARERVRITYQRRARGVGAVFA